VFFLSGVEVSFKISSQLKDGDREIAEDKTLFDGKNLFDDKEIEGNLGV
jgi:hypothetical protein